MRHLLPKCRDARSFVRGSHGCVNVVFDASLARQRGKTLALRFFPLDPASPAFFTPEDVRSAGQRTPQRRLVIEIACDDADAAPVSHARLLSGLRVRPRK
jgi:hypothetical protein